MIPMTALMIIAALFGGLCWAGRSRRSFDTTIVNNDYADDYADDYCDDIACDDGCGSEDTSATDGD
jgi:hypothetical protein